MAAVISKVVKKKVALVFTTAIACSFPIYTICTKIALWNDCQSLQAESSLASSSTRLEKLFLYLLHIFSSTESHQTQQNRWNHQNLAELCDQNIVVISIFVMTSQFVYDSKIFIFTIYNQVFRLGSRIYDFFESFVINCTKQENIKAFVPYLCFSVLVLFVILCFYIAINYHRKLKHSEKRFTSLTPYCTYYSNSSLALTRSEIPVSKYGSISEDNWKYGNKEKSTSISNMASSIIRWVLFLVAFSIFLSIPWEFIRLYQKAVASRAANINMGLPDECSPNSKGWIEKVKSLLRWHLSWSHDHNPCIDYYHATLVDPLWEVNPLLVLSSVLSRGIVHPLEVISSSMGRSVRVFFAEIPAHWQPIIMLVALVTLVIFLLISCSYRVSIPLLLRIEPKTPVGSPDDTKRIKRRTKMPKSRRVAMEDNTKRLAKPANGSNANSLRAG